MYLGGKLPDLQFYNCVYFVVKTIICSCIVFTHGVDKMAVGREGGWQEKVCPGCISETVRCRK